MEKLIIGRSYPQAERHKKCKKSVKKGIDWPEGPNGGILVSVAFHHRDVGVLIVYLREYLISCNGALPISLASFSVT